MSELRKKLGAVKKIFTKDTPKYKRFYNYDPKNPFPESDQTYKKFPQPEPPQKGKGKRRKLKGGKRRKLKGGRRRKQKGGKRKHKGRGRKSIKRRKK